CQQDDDPFDDPQEYWDPESSTPLPGEDELTVEELAGIREAASDEMLALDTASTGRRGPGQAGAARALPGGAASRAAGGGAGVAGGERDGVGRDAGLRPAGGGRRHRGGCRRRRLR